MFTLYSPSFGQGTYTCGLDDTERELFHCEQFTLDVLGGLWHAIEIGLSDVSQLRLMVRLKLQAHA